MNEQERKVMEQALEALEAGHSAIYGTSQTARAIAALRKALEQKPKREPLTNQQIAEILERGDVAESNDKVGWCVLPYSFARAIEAAHGIKENT